MKALAVAWRRLRRGLRSGDLLIGALVLAIAVAATGAVHLFTERVRIAISEQSGDTLGADLVYRARDPLPAALRERIANAGLQSADATLFSSIVFAGDNSSLASVKAVSENYPLRGTIKLAAAPFEDGRDVHRVPAPGAAWADARLWPEIGSASCWGRVWR